MVAFSEKVINIIVSSFKHSLYENFHPFTQKSMTSSIKTGCGGKYDSVSTSQ